MKNIIKKYFIIRLFVSLVFLSKPFPIINGGQWLTTGVAQYTICYKLNKTI